MPCARLSWPPRQLLSARKSTASYRIVSHDGDNENVIMRCSSCIIDVRIVLYLVRERCGSGTVGHATLPSVVVAATNRSSRESTITS